MANSHPDNADQLRGYGKSIMVQGGFLLAFDLVNYFIFKRRGDKQVRLLLSATPNGVGIVVPVSSMPATKGPYPMNAVSN